MTAASLNRPAPPQFQGLDPGLPLTKCTGHVPRWRQPYYSSCLVVLPNHVHLIIRPKGGFRLGNCIQRMKQSVALLVNGTRGRAAALWAEESCDRMMRDEEHLWNGIQYIANNPSRAGLNTSQCPTWIHPEWQSDGWDFVDT